MTMFFTEVKPDSIEPKITHAERIWTIGSCFSDEIGRRMAADLFNVRVNPCGTLYNPASIARMLTRIIDGEPYSKTDVFEHNGLWHCMDFHSSFSGIERAEVLDRINNLIDTLHSEIKTLDRLIITFGSARMFVDRQTGNVAGNCHKLPTSRFEVRDMSVEEIAGLYANIFNRLETLNPQLNIILTVSPIRHKAYGFHADKLSKATLLIAEDMICRATGAAYFPSYEIMDDELRDYRFYAADMIHPSPVACDHIYSGFLQSACTPATITLGQQCRKLSLRMSHRPVGPDKGVYDSFIGETARLAKEMSQRHPELSDTINASIGQFISNNQQQQ